MKVLILYNGSCPILPVEIAWVLSTKCSLLSMPKNLSLLMYFEKMGVSFIESVHQYSDKLEFPTRPIPITKAKKKPLSLLKTSGFHFKR